MNIRPPKPSARNGELKRCPFCGDTATLSQTNDNHGFWFVRCNGSIKLDGTEPCHIAIYPWYAEYKTEDEAIKAWNRRVVTE